MPKLTPSGKKVTRAPPQSRPAGKGKAPRVRKSAFERCSATRVKRLAIGCGVTRMGRDVIEHTRLAMRQLLTEVVTEAVALADARGAKTISVDDAVAATDMTGHPVVGY